MSAALAYTCNLTAAEATAEAERPLWRAKPVDGLAFYRRHTIALLRRYFRVSMELGRTPCLLGNLVFRGRVSSYRMTTFEDMVIFVFDIEKCLKRLDRAGQAAIAHVVLESYTVLEAAMMSGESLRSMTRIYGEALDRLTRLFLDFGLLDPKSEKLSREEAEN
jgi:hypothetical protein